MSHASVCTSKEFIFRLSFQNTKQCQMFIVVRLNVVQVIIFVRMRVRDTALITITTGYNWISDKSSRFVILR